MAGRCSPRPARPTSLRKKFPEILQRTRAPLTSVMDCPPHRARIPSSLVQVATDEVLDIQVRMESSASGPVGSVYRATLTGRSWTKGSSQMGRRLVGPMAVQSRRPGHALYVRTRGDPGEAPRPRYAGSKATPGTTTAWAVEPPGPSPRLSSQFLRSTPPPAALQDFDPADIRHGSKAERLTVKLL